MPHCDNCYQFYPAALPSGCPFCDTRGYHKGPYCQFCGVVHTKGVKEVGDDGRPLRPSCPACGRGPMIPSCAELKRRLTLEPTIEPFVPTPEELAVLNNAGLPDTVTIDGAMLAEVKVRRTPGPIEVYVRSPMIEDYFIQVTKYFGTKGEPQVYSAGPIAAHPYHGCKYYPVNLVSSGFYSGDGTTTFSLRGFGQDTSVPGTAKAKGHSVDLSFLQAVGLKDGVTFKYLTVLDDRTLVECLKLLHHGAVSFYLNFMRSLEHSAVIAVRTQTQGVTPTPPVLTPKPKRY